MIRDRFKKVIRKAAIKAFNMEFDTEDRDPNEGRRGDPTKFDPSVIPKLVDGSGDTPGANHASEIGRTWVSAQLLGGVPPFFLDIRPARETATGTLPNAVTLPGELVKERLDALPSDKSIRVTVYDQTCEQGAFELAEWLRGQGWTMARSLRGGFAEWIEHDEQLDLPKAPKGGSFKLGDPVKTADGKAGFIFKAPSKDAYEAMLDDGTVLGPVGEDALSG